MCNASATYATLADLVHTHISFKPTSFKSLMARALTATVLIATFLHQDVLGYGVGAAYVLSGVFFFVAGQNMPDQQATSNKEEARETD